MTTPRPAHVTGASMASMVAAVAPVHLFGALSPSLQREFGFGDTAQGLAVALFFAVSALLASWGGALTDRIGPTPALRGAAAMSIIGAATLMLSVSYLMVLVAFGVAAVGNAISQPGNNTIINAGVPTQRRGLALGLKQSAIPISTALAGLALPLITNRIDWRWAYLYAITVGAVALVSLPVVESSSKPPSPQRTHHPSRALLLISVGAGAGAAAVASIGAFLVRSLEDAGFSPSRAGLLQFGGSVALIATRVGWGALMDRRPIDRFQFSVGLLAVGAFAFPMLGSGNHAWMVVGALLAYAAAWSFPGVLHLGVVEQHRDTPGGASGVLQAGMFVGATAGPAIFGVVADNAGFRWAWVVSAVAAAVAAGFISVGGRLFRQLTPVAQPS